MMQSEQASLQLAATPISPPGWVRVARLKWVRRVTEVSRGVEAPAFSIPVRASSFREPLSTGSRFPRTFLLGNLVNRGNRLLALLPQPARLASKNQKFRKDLGFLQKQVLPR